VSNGVIDATLTESVQDSGHPTDIILAAAGGWSSNNPPPYDHTIISHPEDPSSNPLNPSESRSYSLYGHWLSGCIGNFCEYPVLQIISMTNNIFQFKSSKASTDVGNQDDSDDTCMLSHNTFGLNPNYDSNGPIRCFNQVKNDHLGWYSDRRKVIQSGDSGLYRVFGITDYQIADDVVRIKITGVLIEGRANDRIFVSYNRKNSFNSGTGEGGDRVLVHAQRWLHGAGESTLVAILAPGESTTVYDNFISYLNAESNHAVVRIGAEPTPSPTSSPTKNPTSSPTTWSKSPTSSPTTSPTTWSKGPTSSPTTWSKSPTSSPTTWSKSPTQAPTSSQCVNTPGWKFIKKKNGQEKGCKWFKKRKQRCNKKAGGMENCPESCNVCEKSGVQVCENRELRKKICKSVSCCTWDKDSKSCKSNVGQSKCF